MLSCVAAVVLSGCVAAFGGTDKTVPPTLGKELTDLPVAPENGAINDEEYDRARAALGRISTLIQGTPRAGEIENQGGCAGLCSLSEAADSSQDLVRS